MHNLRNNLTLSASGIAPKEGMPWAHLSISRSKPMHRCAVSSSSRLHWLSGDTGCCNEEADDEEEEEVVLLSLEVAEGPGGIRRMKSTEESTVEQSLKHNFHRLKVAEQPAIVDLNRLACDA